MILHLLLAASCLAADTKPARLAFVHGQLLERRGAYAEALKEYEAALEKDPRSAYIAREAAELALETGQLPQALKWATKAVELGAGDAATLALLGRVQWSSGETEAAERTFQRALKLDPKSTDSVYSLSSLLAQRSPDEARRLLTRFLEQNPAHAAEAHLQLAKIDLGEGKVKPARKHLQDSIALDPDGESAPARYALAETYENEHSTDAALAEYQKILKLDPQNVQLLDHIAQLQYVKGDWEGMRETLLQAKGAQNDDPTANHWLAMYAEKKGDWEAAAQYVRASAAFDSEPGLHLRLGYYLTQAGKLQDAVKALEAAHAKWPDNDQVSYFLALGYDDMKREDEAIPLLRKIVAVKPEAREARYQLGILLEKRGRMAEAEKEFRALLAEKPDDASVLNYLGYSLADRGLELPYAEELIRKAVALDPGNGAYQDSLGWAHFMMGRSSEAVVELERAAASLPEDDAVWDHLGDAYHAAGQEEKAWKAWKRAESLDSSGKPLKQKAAKIEKSFRPGDLGRMYLEHLRALQGGIRKLGGLCRLEGRILGHEFSHKCLFTFKAPDELQIDILGPMFMPAFSIRLDGHGFRMDPLQIEGLSPEAVHEAAYNAAALYRRYLSGDVFAMKDPAYHKSFWDRKRWVQGRGWRLNLDRASVRAESVQPLDAPDYALRLLDFGRSEGREVPRLLKVTGKGFELGLKFDNVKLDFQK